jgi:O-glycosyl hydrolase
MQDAEATLKTGKNVLARDVPATESSSGLPIREEDAIGFLGGMDRPGVTRSKMGGGERFIAGQRITVPDLPGADTNAVQLTAPATLPIKKGDALLGVFWLRGPGQVQFLFEKSSGPWTKSATQGAKATGEWRRVLVPFVSAEDYAPGEAMASIRLAFGKQTIEVGGWRVYNFEKSKTFEELLELAARLGPTGNVAVNIDRKAVRQTMVGLGGNFMGSWRAAYSEPDDPVERLTRRTLNPRHARLGLSLKLFAPRPGVISETPKTAELLHLAGELTRQKIPVVVSVWEAESWLTGQVEGKNSIPEARWDDAIGIFTEFLRRARKAGARIDYFSFNEPDLGIDIQFSPQRMAGFVKKAVSAFKAAGFSTKWLAGDTANGMGCVRWTAPQLADPECEKCLGPVSFHSWDALTASDADYEAIAALAKKYKRPVWCLEAGHDAQLWQKGGDVWKSWENALQLARAYARTVYHARAEVMDYWTYSDNYPLGDRNGNLYPAGQVLQRLAQAFGPGTKILTHTCESETVTVLIGLSAKGSLHALLVNTGGAGSATLSGLKPGSSRVDLYIGAERPIHAAARTSVGADGKHTVYLPARAVSLATFR